MRAVEWKRKFPDISLTSGRELKSVCVCGGDGGDGP